MCGLSGLWRTGGGAEDALRRDVGAMAAALCTAGPTTPATSSTRRPASRSGSAGWPSSMSRRPATSRCDRRTAGWSSSSTARSTTTAISARCLERGGRRLPRRFRHRGDRRAHGAARRARDPARAVGHVRDRGVGHARARAVAGARSARQEAALLRPRRRRRLALRLGAEEPARVSRLSRRRSIATPWPRCCARRASRRRRRSIAASPSCRPATWRASPRSARARASSRYWRARTVVESALAARARRRPTRRRSTEGRGAAARRGAPPHDRRRAARRVPLGRHRLDRGRRADAGRERRRGSGPSTIGFADPDYDEADVARGRRGAPRHRPHRAARDARGRAGDGAAAAGDLRRAVRRLVADPDGDRLGAGAPPRHGGAARATAATSCSAATRATSGPSAPGGASRRCRRSLRRGAAAIGGRVSPRVVERRRTPSASACCRRTRGSGCPATSCAS